MPLGANNNPLSLILRKQIIILCNAVLWDFCSSGINLEHSLIPFITSGRLYYIICNDIVVLEQYNFWAPRVSILSFKSCAFFSENKSLPNWSIVCTFCYCLIILYALICWVNLIDSFNSWQDSLLSIPFCCRPEINIFILSFNQFIWIPNASTLGKPILFIYITSLE